ncbi:hypothetical protein B296_00039557 [Ensete ventricosum]|uniref:14-3-3 domain-containing protein n=1 Tax=Ensete ventricosum TaxID=4639 RepID=A0A426YGB8_ENSVE|nr:hypothetical protein B296_00039557 [Ensete ventricosum]
MQKVVDAMGEEEELTVEESNLLFVAYENVIVARHASWRIVSSFMQKEGRGNHDHVAAICGYHRRRLQGVKARFAISYRIELSLVWYITSVSSGML